MKTFLKYTTYIVVPTLFGFISSLGGEYDFIYNNATELPTVLLTLIVLQITLTGMILKEIIKFVNSYEIQPDISHVLMALKRNAIIEIVLIGVCYVALMIRGIFQKIDLLQQHCIIETILIIAFNALFSFSLMYFVYIIYDSIDGWFKILNQNNNMNEN